MSRTRRSRPRVVGHVHVGVDAESGEKRRDDLAEGLLAVLAEDDAPLVVGRRQRRREYLEHADGVGPTEIAGA